MYLPIERLFLMLFWLGGVVLATAHYRDGAEVGMFIFGVALTLAGFYPEAFKARRLLERCIRRTSA